MLIPAAKRSSARWASQMACPALGLEALQPLQPEPPPEPAFAEAQKWIEVGAGGDGRPCRGAPSCCPEGCDRGSSPPFPFVASFLRSSTVASSELQFPWRWSPGVVGVNGGGALRFSSAPRGRRRSPVPSSLLLAELAILQSRLGLQALPWEALQTRQGLQLPESLQEPHFRVSRSLLHISPLGLPLRPS